MPQKVTETGNADDGYESNSDGSIMVDSTKISGGAYDTPATLAAGYLAGRYEYALLPDNGWSRADTER